MKKRVGFLGILFLCLIFPLSVGATIIADEDFEDWSTEGWSNTAITTADVFTTFLGRHGTHTGVGPGKLFTLSGNQTEVVISFDFYEIDSWDNEKFRFWINGELQFEDNFNTNREDFSDVSGAQHADSLIFGNGFNNVGFSSWADQGFHYEYTFAFTGTSLGIGFDSTLNQGLSDESFGIDNLLIVDNVQGSPVPEPSTMLLFGLALLGFAGINRRKK